MQKTIRTPGEHHDNRIDQPLVCRLQPKEYVNREGPVPYMGELELENLSNEPIEIEYQMSPLQYLELVVTDNEGEIVSQGHFSDRFSPSKELSRIRLLPGEKYTARVPLLATLPMKQRQKGIYQVQAIYEYNEFQSRSEEVQVDVK